MAKLVLLLSLLSAIIGWSEAGLVDPLSWWWPNAFTRWPNALTRWWTNPLKVEKDVCGFFLKNPTTPRRELKTEKKGKKGERVVALLEFKDTVRHSNKSVQEIHFVCDDETNRKIMHHANNLEFTVEFDLYLNDGIPYAHVNYLGYLVHSPQTKYIIIQSGASGRAAYDVSVIEEYSTAIIPSHLLTGKREENSAEQYGYWFDDYQNVTMHFAGSGTKTIKASELRFQYEKVPRTHTTVAFHHNDGTIGVFPVSSIDEATTVLRCKNMEDSRWAIVLSEQERLDKKFFYSCVWNIFILFESVKTKYSRPKHGRSGGDRESRNG